MINIYNFDELKSKTYYKEFEKDLLDYFEKKVGEYTIGTILNYIPEKKNYEVYCFIQFNHKQVVGLKSHLLKNKKIAQLYFKYLKKNIENKGLRFF